MFESLEGEQLQPYMDAIELEGNAAQPMDEGGVEEEKVKSSSLLELHHRCCYREYLSCRQTIIYEVLRGIRCVCVPRSGVYAVARAPGDGQVLSQRAVMFMINTPLVGLCTRVFVDQVVFLLQGTILGRGQ